MTDLTQVTQVPANCKRLESQRIIEAPSTYPYGFRLATEYRYGAD